MKQLKISDISRRSFVEVDAHIAPAECTIFSGFFGEFVRTKGSPWAQGELSAKLTEGIRTSQISEHSVPCNLSPPSFSSKMPPPLTARGAARGGFRFSASLSANLQLPIWRSRAPPLPRLWANSYCHTNFERRAFLPQLFKRSYPQIRYTVTGGAYLSARRVSLCVRNDL